MFKGLAEKKKGGQSKQQQQPGSQVSTQMLKQLSELNALRKQMTESALEFSEEIQSMKSKLLRKLSELELLSGRQIAQISQKNIRLLEDLIQYQKQIIEKLENKDNKWEVVYEQVHRLDAEIQALLGEDTLVSKLVRIEAEEQQVQKLLREVEELERQKQGSALTINSSTEIRQGRRGY